MKRRLFIASLLAVFMCLVGYDAIFGRESNDASLRTALESVSTLAKSKQVIPISSYFSSLGIADYF